MSGSMSEPRPASDFTRYERPANWVCGRACEGCGCTSGPTPWGKCQEEEPCVPQRSLRSLRRLFVFGCTALGVAMLLVMLSKTWWTEALAPGPLTLKHAQILKGNGSSNRCAACHEAGDKKITDWAMHLVGTSSLQTPQSTLCLKCHEKGLDAAHALLPHGVDPERLVRHTVETAMGRKPGRQGLVSIPRNEHREIGCSACHREHHGKDFDLTAMSNQQCQTCHAKSFHSFASGHPEFTSWPFEQRRPIAFDHTSHKEKHFPTGKQSFRCETCHVDDSRQDVKLLTGYEAACTSCHEPRIRQSGEDGWRLFTLPGMNVAALGEAGISIGEWPEGISQDFDGAIPPPMALLLSADKKGAAALAKIPGGDLSAVDPANNEQLVAAADVALASKQLLHELVNEGEVALARRLSYGTGEKTARLWAQLPKDLLASSQAAWLPQLEEEMALLRAGQPLPPSKSQEPEASPQTIKEPAPPTKKVDEGNDLLITPADEKPKPETPSAEVAQLARSPVQTASAGWLRNDASYSIAYRPAGHADPLLKAWIELSLRASTNGSPATDALRVSLTKTTSIGYCAQCHSIDRDSSGNLAIHWNASRRDLAARPFTKFSHRPHLIQPELQGCTHCHAPATDAQVMASYAQDNPHEFTAGFAPLQKSACTSCHTPTAAGDGCLKCHNYHVSRLKDGF